ncbi:MAG: hypothetical protein KIT84_10655 [Labilithrix sp.]|nr:hypothetical protein [Labilithrix sp.]
MYASLSFAALVVLTCAAGCRSGKNGSADADATARADEVADPRAYVRAAYLQHPAPWAGTADYNLDDTALLDEIIDEAMRTRRRQWKGTLPSAKKELDAFIQLSKGMYTTALLATPERRARVETLIRERFAQPKVTTNGGEVVADMGLAAATFENARIGWELRASLHVERNELASAEVNRAFCLLEKAPPASVRVVRVTLPLGKIRRTLTYRYPRHGDRLELTEKESYVSRKAIGGLDQFCKGRVATHSSDMVSTSAERWEELLQ